MSVGTASGGGQVSIASDGQSLEYTPAGNFNGEETFTYTAENTGGVQATATVTVQITDINDDPVALNDSFSVDRASTNNELDVLSNDNSGVDNANSETLTITDVSGGSNGGAVTIGNSGLVINYTPGSTFEGTETFTYTISDGRGGTSQGTVSVAVNSDNPAPVPTNDEFSVQEDASSASFDVLANDTTDPNETLTINGVTVELFSGMSQAQVVDRINQFTTQSSVAAEVDGTTTRLYSTAFGSASQIEVVSNVAGAATSTGFGTAALNDAGVDIQVAVDGSTFSGQGNVVTVDSGIVKGLSLSLAVDSSDVTMTVTGAKGNITVSDNSLVFQIGPNQYQTAKVAVSKAHTASLGLGVAGNQFNNLSEIDISSDGKAQDSLSIIDAAVDDVTNMRGTLGAFQSNTLEATANNLRATLENSVNANSVIRDTDFAAEIAEFTKQQVLMQAGSTVLGNANQIPQLVLGLLG